MENIDTDVKVQRVKRQITEREKKREAKESTYQLLYGHLYKFSKF